MKDGQIAERGRHDELLKKNGELFFFFKFLNKSTRKFGICTYQFRLDETRTRVEFKLRKMFGLQMNSCMKICLQQFWAKIKMSNFSEHATELCSLFHQFFLFDFSNVSSFANCPFNFFSLTGIYANMWNVQNDTNKPTANDISTKDIHRKEDWIFEIIVFYLFIYFYTLSSSVNQYNKGY